MSAEDVTDAPWAAVVDGPMVYVVVDDDDLEPTVCDIPTYDHNGLLTPLVERVEVAERIVADHRAGRVRRSGESFHASHRGVDVVATPW